MFNRGSGIQHMQNCRVAYLALKHSFECMNPKLNSSFIHRLVICHRTLAASIATKTLYADPREVSHAKSTIFNFFIAKGTEGTVNCRGADILMQLDASTLAPTRAGLSAGTGFPGLLRECGELVHYNFITNAFIILRNPRDYFAMSMTEPWKLCLIPGSSRTHCG